MAQKHVDPDSDPNPQHCFNLYPGPGSGAFLFRDDKIRIREPGLNIPDQQHWQIKQTFLLIRSEPDPAQS
jgi:hypothetical protein